jgi:hypothetical protein
MQHDRRSPRLLPLRMEVDSLPHGLRVVVRVSDRLVADGDRFNLGGDDPDFARFDEDAIVVEDRLPIKLGIATPWVAPISVRECVNCGIIASLPAPHSLRWLRQLFVD